MPIFVGSAEQPSIRGNDQEEHVCLQRQEQRRATLRHPQREGEQVSRSDYSVCTALWSL